MSAVSGIVGAGAAKSAGKSQAKAATDAAKISADVQLKMFERGVRLTEPWREAGEEALGVLQERVTAGPGEFDYEKSPGYDFRLAEGEKAIERSAAARGNLLGGATGKALQRYGQDYASGDYNKEYDNFLRRYYEGLTPLQSLAGVGQSTASQTAGQAGAVGANIGNTQFQGGIAAGNAIAGGQINQANAITGAIQSGTSNALLGYNQWKNTTPPIGAGIPGYTTGINNIGQSAGYK